MRAYHVVSPSPTETLIVGDQYCTLILRVHREIIVRRSCEPGIGCSPADTPGTSQRMRYRDIHIVVDAA